MPHSVRESGRLQIEAECVAGAVPEAVRRLAWRGLRDFLPMALTSPGAACESRGA